MTSWIVSHKGKRLLRKPHHLAGIAACHWYPASVAYLEAA